VRKQCDPEKNGESCYKQMTWIDKWMNDPKVKVALGVDPTRTFTSCNKAVNLAFTLQGDSMHNSAVLLSDLIDDGIRLLIYAGNAGASHALVTGPAHGAQHRHGVRLHRQ
jgi:cathepsin A (carboxypeptidase C)